MQDPSRFVVINEFVSIERRRKLFAEAAVVVLPYVEASQSGVVPIVRATKSLWWSPPSEDSRDG